MSESDTARLARLEARVDALSATVKTVLTTLMLRGLLTQAAVKQVLDEAEQTLAAGDKQAGGADELRGIEADLPAYKRAAMGPPPDPDEDHE
ncbi:MAG TPA: hypothetical protein VG271_14505 [Beijerinckiaceae bacterium]|jgi:hypothetical protein|nr:hypothetical protein [Beijerinckiaceae bacterium]